LEISFDLPKWPYKADHFGWLLAKTNRRQRSGGSAFGCLDLRHATDALGPLSFERISRYFAVPVQIDPGSLAAVSNISPPQRVTNLLLFSEANES